MINIRYVEQSAAVVPQESGMAGLYKAIAYAAKKSHLSEGVTQKTDFEMVQMLINRGHTACLEFGSVYLTLPLHKMNWSFLGHRTWCKVRFHNFKWYISTNYRYIYERNLDKYLEYMCDPTEYHHKRFTIDATTSIHCYKDITRHRVFSFNIESTRFCNYTKDRFNKEIKVIIPVNSPFKPDDTYCLNRIEKVSTQDMPKPWIEFTKSMCNAAIGYFKMISNNFTAQDAAKVLPQNTKGEMCMCGFEKDWNHFFDLRLYGKRGAPLPEVKHLAGLIYNEIKPLMNNGQ